MHQQAQHTEKNYLEIDILDSETMDVLKEFAQGNPDVVRDIINSFEPEGSVLIDEICTSIATKNLEMLRKSAHSLAGISGSIGASRLKEICADTENSVKAHRNDDAFIIAGKIIPAYNEVVTLLKST